MKSLITETSTFGPFTSIVKGEDRWYCDGAEYPFSAVGDASVGEWVNPAPLVDPIEYQRLRAAEYPPITDYVDGIVKDDTDQVKAYINACLAIKAKYPKPE